MNLNNFSGLCRCCMDIGTMEIFENVFENVSLATVIEKCTQKTLSLRDDLPKKICQKCFDKLATSYSFIRKFHQVQESLKQLLYSTKIKSLCKGITNDQVISTEDILPDNRTDFALYNSNIDICKHHECKKHIDGSDDDIPLSKLKKSLGSLENSNLDKRKSESGQTNLNKTTGNRHFHTKHILQNVRGRTDRIRRKDEKYYCLKCNECFNNIKLLVKHCRNTGHPIPRRYQCETCLMKFLTKSSLKSHLRIHSKEQPYICEICKMKFSLNSNLQRHKRRHTGEKDFFCEICGRGFIQKYTLTIHMRLHNGETPYKCQECGKGYRAKSLLTQHLNKHKGLETYYHQHYLKHGSLKVECSICKKQLTKSGLYTHMKVQHGDGLKTFLCNLCGKKYSSKKYLEIHMNIHTRKITYNCDVCKKTFSHHNYLKIHMRIHSGEKPHCCHTCGKTFTQRAHLDGHMRTHTGARPYNCNYCNKSFALKGNLMVHLRIHTGQRPHHCSICNKEFFNLSNKKKHESSVHQITHDTKSRLDA
ncbi:hypothetical protein WA026_022513 [Henosepilachna vigintioctopunctata]|uniref:Gastrula zinc finger protein XlCGF57.1-like n=1 Tax=Henosepilachna vigintioctopunctata TaxID=420089 RepID=A0AAW1USX7_9CUCU